MRYQLSLLFPAHAVDILRKRGFPHVVSWRGGINSWLEQQEPNAPWQDRSLTVDFMEKMYAVGRIPGGYLKREGRASDKGTLTARARATGQNSVSIKIQN